MLNGFRGKNKTKKNSECNKAYLNEHDVFHKSQYELYK